MSKYGYLGGLGGYRYSPSRHPPSPIPRVHPSCRHSSVPRLLHGLYTRSNMVVGLYSVDQLSLDVHISGFWGMTEVYNLVKVGRIINH